MRLGGCPFISCVTRSDTYTPSLPPSLSLFMLRSLYIIMAGSESGARSTDPGPAGEPIETVYIVFVGLCALSLALIGSQALPLADCGAGLGSYWLSLPDYGAGPCGSLVGEGEGCGYHRSAH
ncbi:hypothetical protein FKM82_002291 [Ascaphus truei]